MINETRNQDSTIWLYESVQEMNLTPSEELFYCFLIKKTFYEMKGICEEAMTDSQGKINWLNINDEFGEYAVIPFWVYQTNQFQKYIEDALGISRRSFFNILKSFKEKGLLTTFDARGMYTYNSVVELFKDDYRYERIIDQDKYQEKCYMLSIDYEKLYTDHYRSVYLKQSLLKSPKLLYFYSWMLDHFTYWNKQGKKFISSAEHLAEEYGITTKNFSKMVTELKTYGLISKDYKKEWYVLQ